MDYAYEEDLQVAIAELKKRQSEFDLQCLVQLWNRLEKKLKEMSMVWQTEHSSQEMKDIQKMCEKINIDELYSLIDSIQEIQIRYDFDMMQVTDERQGV